MKKRLKGLAVGVSLVMILGVLAGCGGEKKKETEGKKVVNVGIIQLAEHAALDAANKGFVKGLEDNGYKENVNIKFDRQNAQGDHANLQNIANRFVSNKVDLICAISTPAAQSVANATKDIPIVGTAITDYVTAKLVVSNNEPKTNVTGTTNMNSIDKHIDLILKIAPQTKQIGVIYNTSEVNSQVQVRILKPRQVQIRHRYDLRARAVGIPANEILNSSLPDKEIPGEGEALEEDGERHAHDDHPLPPLLVSLKLRILQI